jgi:hypothetical protein
VTLGTVRTAINKMEAVRMLGFNVKERLPVIGDLLGRINRRALTCIKPL